VPDQRVGSAYYDLELRDQKLLSAVERDNAKIKQAGTDAERAFGASATKGVDSYGDAHDRAGEKVRGFGGVVRDLAGGALMGVGIAAFTAVTAAVGGLSSAIIGGASDWNENLSKSRVVFGQFAGDIEKWASDAPAKLAMTQSAALGAASTFGNLFVALNIGPQKAAPMSAALVQLATDLSSFNNVPVDDALQALQSGLVGETEPLRRFGVNLNEATIQQKALELGLISSTKQAITPAIKAQAAYALILDQTKTAQGDFARTADGLANSQRIATATLNDGLAKLGQRILPVLVAIMPKFIGFLTTAFDVLGGAADVIGGVLGAFQKFVDFLSANVATVGTFGAAMAAMMAPAVIAGIESGLLAAIGAVASFLTKLEVQAAAASTSWIAILGPTAVVAAAAAAAVYEIQDAHDHAAERITEDQARVADGTANMYDRMVAAYAKTHGLVTASVEASSTAVETATDTAHTAGEGFAAAADEMAARQSVATTHMAADADEMANRWTAAGVEIVDGATNIAKQLPPMARKAGYETLSNLAEGINAARQLPLDAFDNLIAAMKKPLTETAETARLLGELADKRLTEGLKSGDAAIRAQAAATKRAILDRLDEITPGAGTVGKEAGKSLAAALKSKDPEIAERAKEIKLHIQAELALKDAKVWAQMAAESYAQGFASREDYLSERVRTFLHGASAQMIAESPPKAGPLKDIEKWARATGLAWVDSFIAAMQTAPKKLKDVLDAVGSMLANYKPSGSYIPSFTPEAQRADLASYIDNLTKKLAGTYDPKERLAIEQEIAEYQKRLAALQGQTATEAQKDMQTLKGYISNLDRALLTEKDPTRRQQLLDKLTLYMRRLDDIEAKTQAAADQMAAAARAPAYGGTPVAQTGAEASAKLQQYISDHDYAHMDTFDEAANAGGVPGAQAWLDAHPGWQPPWAAQDDSQTGTAFQAAPDYTPADYGVPAGSYAAPAAQMATQAITNNVSITIGPITVGADMSTLNATDLGRILGDRLQLILGQSNLLGLIPGR
jgi:hypothetical protein